jgi:hypothetical protein
MKIKAIQVTGRDLKPGDLFSTRGPEYWDNYRQRLSLAEKVWLRTETPSSFADDADAIVYRIEIDCES